MLGFDHFVLSNGDTTICRPGPLKDALRDLIRTWLWSSSADIWFSRHGDNIHCSFPPKAIVSPVNICRLALLSRFLRDVHSSPALTQNSCHSLNKSATGAWSEDFSLHGPWTTLSTCELWLICFHTVSFHSLFSCEWICCQRSKVKQLFSLSQWQRSAKLLYETICAEQQMKPLDRAQQVTNTKVINTYAKLDGDVCRLLYQRERGRRTDVVCDLNKR